MHSYIRVTFYPRFYFIRDPREMVNEHSEGASRFLRLLIKLPIKKA